MDQIGVFINAQFLHSYPHGNLWEFVTGLSGVSHFTVIIYHVNVTEKTEGPSDLRDQGVNVVSDMTPFGVMFRAVLTLGEVWAAYFFDLQNEISKEIIKGRVITGTTFLLITAMKVQISEV